MKKYILIVSLLLLISGCAFFQAQKANWEACQADSECLAKAHHYQNITESVSVIPASAIPFPGAAAAPKILGYIAFGISMLLGGHALTKKKKESEIV